MSANRQTKISLVETGDQTSRVVNSSINYQQKTYQLLKKHIEGCLRTRPTDPSYDIETISFKDKDSKEHLIITSDNFEEIKSKIFELSNVQMKAKVSLRPASPMKGRSRRETQNDENQPNNTTFTVPSPMQVRRAGSPPKRNVCSPLRRNTNKVTTQLSPSTTPTPCSATPVTSIRSAIRSATNITSPPLRTGSPLKRGNSPLKRVPACGTPSRHKSPANIRRTRVNSSTTPVASSESITTTPSDTKPATPGNNLRMLSRSSMKRNRSSPNKDVPDNNHPVDSSISAEDIDLEIENMTVPLPLQETPLDEPSAQVLEVSPVPSHHETWKDIYTPRNSHSIDDGENEQSADDNTSPEKDVVCNIFPDEESTVVEEENDPPVISNPEESENLDNLTLKQKIILKEATPRFHVKEKTQQIAPETKEATATAAQHESRPSFMKDTRSSQNHFQKGRKSNLKWEHRLRKNDDIAQKVHKSMTDRKLYRESMMKAIRSDTKTLQPDGRPSLDTMTAQWEFMRNQFLGSNNEALEWMMQAKSGGVQAYKHAQRKQQIAEDQYFKSLFEIDILEAKQNILAGPGSRLLSILNVIAQCSDVLSLNPTDSEKKAIVRDQQETLKNYFQEELKGICCQNLQKDIQAIFELTEEHRASKKARHVVSNSYPAELSEIKERLRKSIQAKEESLTEMEKWDERLKETAEYEKVIAQKETKWMDDFREGNLLCLRKMRSLIPVNISSLSVNDLLKEVENRGALYTHELALEIKNNKLLHWLLMAPEDIAMTNFLSGEHRQFFVNLDCLDVVEMRALRMVLPDKFELDQDGQKAEWRERFISRLKQLVAQQNEDYVKGGWDAESGKRSMVKLPDLKPDQRRRQLYYFRTHEQMINKLKQFQDKGSLLEKKKKLLLKANEDVKNCRQEYNCILEESRDPYFRSEVGLEQLNNAKSEVKNELRTAESKQKFLENDVRRIEKSIKDMPMTQEEFEDMIQKQGLYLNSNANAQTSKEEQEFDFFEATDSVEITGPFEESPEIKRIERSSAKFQTAEQEAIQRKLELSKVKMSESASTTEVTNDIPVERKISTVDKSIFERKSNGGDECDDSKLSTPQQPRRGSVLLSANKHVIETLNNMFSPSTVKGGHVSETAPKICVTSDNRNSIFSPSTLRRESVMSVGSDASSQAIEKKEAKSRTLKKLLERKESGNTEETPARRPNPFMMAGGGGGGLSFLDQIKAKRKTQE